MSSSLQGFVFEKNLNSQRSKMQKGESLGKSFYSLSFNFQKGFEFHSISHNQSNNQSNLSIYYNIPKFRILGCYNTSSAYISPYTLKTSVGTIDREFRRQKPPQPPKANLDPFRHPAGGGNPSLVAIFIITMLSMTRREQFSLGLRVCTSSYVFDLSLVFLIRHNLDVSRALLLQLDLMMYLPLYSLIMY